MTFNLDSLINDKIKSKWLDIIKKESNQEYFKKILEKINKNISLQIFPKPKNVFKAFTYFEPHETKLVLLGQDPYIGYEIHNEKKISQAMGLSFSVPKKFKKVPPSLKNIYKEIKSNYPDFKIPNHGNLKKWAKNERILLLNASLTVIEGKSGSHLKFWEKFTDKIISYLSENNNNVIFMLLGNYAKQKISLIDQNKHCIITAVHPSPLSASRGFFGSKVFLKANEFLRKNNIEEINWSI